MGTQFRELDDPTQFRSLLEALPVGAYTCDVNGFITSFNDRVVRLFGRAPKPGEPAELFLELVKSKSGDDGQEVAVTRPDGTRVAALSYTSPICDDAGKLSGTLNVLVDVSERKQAEEALKSADRAKDEFLATLAHELRNPLAPISNALQFLLCEVASSPERQRAVEMIERQVKNLSRLVDDLLDLSRITSNKLELRRDRIDLKDVLHTAVETSRPLIEAFGHRFVDKTGLGPRPLIVDGDATRLGQVVSNLLNNACKYTPRGGTIELCAEQKGSQAVITVRDTGVGIAKEMLPRIFDMFTQVEWARERSQGGLGIGLTLAKRLLDAHGGSLSASSEGVGKGSEFVISLPLVSGGISGQKPAESRLEPQAARSGLRILVVDDNRDSATSLGMLLEILGNEIRMAHDGYAAIAAAAEFRPDVVLLDIGLPKLNGYLAAQKIRQEPWGKDMLLIAITGWGQDTDRQRSEEAGFNHHLVKPVDIAMLKPLLTPVLERLTKNAASL